MRPPLDYRTLKQARFSGAGPAERDRAENGKVTPARAV